MGWTARGRKYYIDHNTRLVIFFLGNPFDLLRYFYIFLSKDDPMGMASGR